MSEFNAKQARGKRPCPLWVDAFQRDTQHLEADEVGAYMLILMAMWTRESCDFPADDRRMARVCRVSLRLWKSRIGPTIMAFLKVEDGAAISERLRKEATYVERQVQAQSDRKAGEKSDNLLKSNNPAPSADSTVDKPPNEPRRHPSQQPNVRDDDEAGARPRDLSFREKILDRMGHDPTGVTATGQLVGGQSDMIDAQRWKDDLGLTEPEILAVVAEITLKRQGQPPPKSLRYFNEPMREFAGRKNAEALTPKLTAIPGGQNAKAQPGQHTAIANEIAERFLDGRIKHDPLG